MLLGFIKYKSSGNNFIIVDNRDRKYKVTGEQIKFLCDFKNGIGSDGLIIINQSRNCLLYTSPSPRDKRQSRMPSSA